VGHWRQAAAPEKVHPKISARTLRRGILGSDDAERHAMTEDEWLSCADPTPMLEFLVGRASKRREYLFGVACCRRVAHLYQGRRFWVGPDGEPYLNRPGEYVELTERLADEPAPLRFGEYGDDCPDGYSDEGHATLAADAALYSCHAERASTYASWAAAATSAGYEDGYEHVQSAPTLPGYATERAIQAELLRCIVGNPFRAVAPDPAWQTPNAVTLARTIPDERRWELLPLLADLLEEEGCGADVSAHCRGPGPHARGCWVVDLVLGKE
jgi:hypothetical protein